MPGDSLLALQIEAGQASGVCRQSQPLAQLAVDAVRGRGGEEDSGGSSQGRVRELTTTQNRKQQIRPQRVETNVGISQEGHIVCSRESGHSR